MSDDNHLSKIFGNSLNGKADNKNSDAELIAALMIQSNALISIKTAVSLCSISRQEIDRRVHIGTFPKPMKLSSEEKSIRKAFRIGDIIDWLHDPVGYKQPNQTNSNSPKTI